jgi:hypothetical protein
VNVTTNPVQIRLARRSPAYWRVTIDNPPINVMGPDMLRQPIAIGCVKSWAGSIQQACAGFGNPALDHRTSRKVTDWSNVMRLAALSFAILMFATTASLTQGVPALRQAPVGHRQPTQSDPPLDVGKDEQLPSASAARQPASAPSQRQTARTRAGGPPTLQVGPSCEAAGRGAVMLGRNKEACLADETVSQDTLKQNWSKYSAADKTTCIGMETAGGPASYVELLSCLEVLRDAKGIEATDPLAGGDVESGTSRAEVTHGSRIRNRHADRGHTCLAGTRPRLLQRLYTRTIANSSREPHLRSGHFTS